MTSPATDPRAARSREAILAAAYDLLAREGPGAITHQRVAQQAGVGRATVYRHWAAPQDLLRDVLFSAELPFFATPALPLRPWLHAELRQLADELALPAVASLAIALMEQTRPGGARARPPRPVLEAGRGPARSQPDQGHHRPVALRRRRRQVASLGVEPRPDGGDPGRAGPGGVHLRHRQQDKMLDLFDRVFLLHIDGATQQA